MLNAYERRLALSYLANMFARLDRNRTEGKSLVEWLEENAALIASGARSSERMRKTASTAAVSVGNWCTLRKLVQKASVASADALPDHMGRRLGRLAEASVSRRWMSPCLRFSCATKRSRLSSP